MFEWIDPPFDVAGACLTLLILVTCTAAAVRGSTAKARAARDRLVAAPGGRIRLYRAGIRTSMMLAVAAFAVVWTDGVDLADLGLDLPTGRDVSTSVLLPSLLASAVLVPAVIAGTVRVAAARRDGDPDGADTRGGRRARSLGGAEETLARVRFMHPTTAAERWLAGGLSAGVGVAEELVYRGLFIAAGTGLLGLDARVAALLSLVVFGVDHLYQGWRGAVSATVLGAFFTLLYAVTGAIFAPIIVHTVFDVTALVVAPWLGRRVERRPRRTPASAPSLRPAPATTPSPASTPATTANGPISLRSAVPE
ncbi:CPBP family intramembrane metalloprotease [Dactylosporangium sp. NBC_01737]|uniref:CPBP family intramembrane glutamic endopeptidase n=1 Tax=Dactylosporangium sp. NBC_01737 TaxID=2975959 RepID=UPI002E10C01A|nr:CPBP family intramembrane metalloprotease [Dactylosporangium sp. NBC_01737]